MKLVTLLFALIFEVHGLTEDEVVGYWVGVNPSSSGQNHFQVYYNPNKTWEFRSMRLWNEDGDTTYIHRSGEWKIVRDSIYTKSEFAKKLSVTSGDTCCAYILDYNGNSAEVYQEDGVNKMRIILKYEGIIDTAFFKYVSTGPAFTYRNLLGVSAVNKEFFFANAKQGHRRFRGVISIGMKQYFINGKNVPKK